jgi:hypothetical protein
VVLREEPANPERVNFVRDLLNEDLNVAIANAVGTWAAVHANNRLNEEPVTEESTVINAIAKGVESAERHASNGIAWVVTGITGMPEFPARVIGAVITSATMPSVEVLADGLRVFGAVRSGLAGTLGRCACLDDLTVKYVFEQPISAITEDILDRFGGLEPPPEPPEPEDPPPPQPPGPGGL